MNIAGVWLEYGLDPRGSLVHIADTPERGKTRLRCPYCQGDLTADRVAWRFAHAGDACPPTMRKDDVPVLPLYHDFSLGLTPRESNALRAVDVRGRACDEKLVSNLAGRGFCQWNPYRGRGAGYELTKLGKIPFGQLSLYLFNQVQGSLIKNRMETLRKKAKTGDAGCPGRPAYFSRPCQARPGQYAVFPRSAVVRWNASQNRRHDQNSPGAYGRSRY